MKKEIIKDHVKKKIIFPIIFVGLILYSYSIILALGNLTIQLPSQTVYQGDQFNISINVSGITDLYGYQLDISYNPNIINYTGIEEGPFLKSDGADTYFSSPDTSSPGILKNILGTRQKEIPGLSGNGILAKLYFKALNPGTTYINISGDKLINSSVDEMLHNTINKSITIQADTNYPIFSNYLESPNDPATYLFNQVYSFSSTVLNTNGTVGIEFNGKNYTATNSSNVFSVSISGLSAGLYSYYRWGYGNGYNKLFNKSSSFTYTINKASLTGSLTSSATWNIIYGTSTIISYSDANQGDSDVVYKVFRDNIDKGLGETITLGVGTYQYKLNSTGGQNYSANPNLNSQTLTINQASTTTTLTTTPATPITYLQACNFSCSNSAGLSTILYIDNVDKSSEKGLNIIRAAKPSGYVVSCNSTGNQNYTGSSQQTNYVINKANSVVYTYLNNSRADITINQFDSILLNGSRINGEGIIQLYKNGALINQGTPNINNLTTFNTLGLYNITTIYSATQNYTASYETWWVTVAVDNIYPQFSNYQDNNDTVALNGTGIFNVTVINTNGTVLLEINNTNYSASLNSGKYIASVYLVNRTYNYRWISFGNGFAHNINSSTIMSYTVLNYLFEDINMDRKVNVLDLILVATSVGGSGCNSANNYCQRKDVNRDTYVDIKDLVRVARKIQ